MTKPIHAGGGPCGPKISLKAIVKNLRVIRRHIGPKPKILAVVKSNAYGLGAVPISKTLQKAGAEWFGVTCANEGIELREAASASRSWSSPVFGRARRSASSRIDLTPTVTRAGRRATSRARREILRA